MPFEESFSSTDIANALKIPNQVFPNGEHIDAFDHIYPELIVCVAYRAAFSDTQYHTGYIIKLGRINPETPFILPLKSGKIPASELKLYISPYYAMYAD